MATDQYGVTIPPVRPDAAEEDTNARPSNAFKQALSLFMYGSRDPSYVDRGEFRARGTFQHYAGEGMALSAIARPEVAASIYQSYANQGAQAAQNMRERYYEKEHRQMMQLQIAPLAQEWNDATRNYQARTAISFLPTKRTATPEEAHARGVAMQATTPAPQEVLKTGKTAEGKDKTEVIDGVAPPQPNAAIGQQTLGAVEFTPETLSFTDPNSGAQVPIASYMGQRIQRDADDQLMAAHNKFVIGMMDTFAQYPGNPFAVQSMQKIMDGMINTAGTAVTGRADPYEQLKHRQEYEQNQLKIAQGYSALQNQGAVTAFNTTRSNQLLRGYQQGESGNTAQAAEGAQRAMNDQEFFNSLSPRLQNKIKTDGTNMDNWNQKDIDDMAARGTLRTTMVEKDMARERRAGMIRIEPVSFDKPQQWQSQLSRNPDHVTRLKGRRHQLLITAENQLRGVGNLPADQQDSTMDHMGVTPSKTVRDMIKSGDFEQKLVQDEVLKRASSSDNWAKADEDTTRESLGLALDAQPDLRAHMQEQANAYAEQYKTRMLAARRDPAEVQNEVDKMKADIIGTHIMMTTGQTPRSNWLPAGEAQRLQDTFYGPRTISPEEHGQIKEDARSAMGLPPADPQEEAKVQPAENPEEESHVTPDQAASAEPKDMTPDQIDAAVDMIKGRRDELIKARFANKADRDKAQDQVAKMDDRVQELEVHQTRQAFEYSPSAMTQPQISRAMTTVGTEIANSERTMNDPMQTPEVRAQAGELYQRLNERMSDLRSHYDDILTRMGMGVYNWFDRQGESADQSRASDAEFTKTLLRRVPKAN